MTAFIRLYAELLDYLPLAGRCLACPLEKPEPVEGVLRRLGVPMEQVDLVLVNGTSAGAGARIFPGDEVSVYPVFESFDIRSVVRLRDRPLRRVRFVADVHLGKLATFLRMLGFDTLYRNDYQDWQLVGISVGEGRVLLTRDRTLIEQGGVTRGYLVRESVSRRQLGEVVRRFDLYALVDPFTKCLRCNTDIVMVSKDSVMRRLPPVVRLCFDTFWRCRTCDRIYWRGGHVQRMTELIASLKSDEVSGEGVHTGE
ncbi:MAG: Mut7-C ubiquitin/RNAse domain-containing protein [Ignavibacteria bacterium]|nr:Mut7-C ubiquitin/RNAse domain-containing protein [Ignavibacteria bacterium]